MNDVYWLAVVVLVLPAIFIWGYLLGLRDRRTQRPNVTQPRR